MLNFRQLRNAVIFIVVTASLCVTIQKQANSKENGNVKPASPSPSPTASPSPSPTISPIIPSPTTSAKLGIPSDKNPLINNNCGWEVTKINPSEQLKAFRFNKKGQMRIYYNSASGGFFRNAKYELDNNSNKYPQPINIIIGNRTIETIFEIKEYMLNNKKSQTLRIEIIDVKPGQPRPSQITQKGVREFRPSCFLL
jgi:hypothetical protein